MAEIAVTKELKGVNLPKTKLGLTKLNVIVRAAEKLFTENGFYDTSISDICKRAHTAVGTFYIYFENKVAVYRYLVAEYRLVIRNVLAEATEKCTTRLEREREGIRAFIEYAAKNPSVYDIIWGSLSVDRQIFIDYYTTFAESYRRGLVRDGDAVKVADSLTLAYALMGITNFVGLRALFEDMSTEQIDLMVDDCVMKLLRSGAFVDNRA